MFLASKLNGVLVLSRGFIAFESCYFVDVGVLALHFLARLFLWCKVIQRFMAQSFFSSGVRDGAERQQWDDLSSILNSVVISSSKDRWTCDLSGGESSSMFSFDVSWLGVVLVKFVVGGIWIAGDLFFLELGCLVLILSAFFPSQVYFRRCFLCCLVADLEASKSVGL
ncbi:hypothetical protein Tco_1190788 [Tanacetum coccineum]